jgi:hypothetical protein
MIRFVRLLLVVGMLSLAASAHSQLIPATAVKTLRGGRIVLPVPASSKPLIVLISFSHSGGDDAAVWNKDFKVQYETDPRVGYCELADFQGVPGLVMRMILHGMRREVQEPEKSHLGLMYSGEEDWKKLVDYGNPNITYVILADGGGHVLWQTRGPATRSKAAELEKAVESAVAGNQQHGH